MHRSSMKLAIGAAMFVHCLMLTACGLETDLEAARPHVNPEMVLVSLDAPRSKGYAWNAAHRRLEPVQYAEVDGMAVVEGDMIIGTVEEVKARAREVEAMGGPEVGRVHEQGVAINNIDARWPNGVVPYTIDPALPTPSRVTGAINSWQGATYIRFVLRTASNAAQYPDYVTFQKTAGGCFSSVGKNGGQQIVNLEDACTTGNAIHEIGHVLGLFHEQSREDRDSFVRIQLENVTAGYEGNFDKQITYGGDLFAYDYGSIMHYPADAFSKNGLPTIVALGGQAIGQRSALSTGDVASIKRIYSSDDSEFFIQQTYHDVLNRAPDRDGFYFYLHILQNCNGDSACLAAYRVTIARGMLESPENRQQNPDLNPASSGYNSAFVTHCYTSFLRRQPSASEVSWWLNILNSNGDYGAIVNGFITSAEYRQRFGAQ